MTASGGNYSDSGISDSGSDVDLSEREKKLAALRRLVRHLDTVLAPGSAAIVNMAKVCCIVILYVKLVLNIQSVRIFFFCVSITKLIN